MPAAAQQRPSPNSTYAMDDIKFVHHLLSRECNGLSEKTCVLSNGVEAMAMASALKSMSDEGRGLRAGAAGD